MLWCTIALFTFTKTVTTEAPAVPLGNGLPPPAMLNLLLPVGIRSVSVEVRGRILRLIPSTDSSQWIMQNKGKTGA
jgi:hypothetical protein